MELNKENLYQKYIVENKSGMECSEVFGCSKSLIKKRLKIYGIKKDSKLIGEVRVRKTMEKYGVRSTSQIKEVAEKISNTQKNRTEEQKSEMLNKLRNTMNEKYGVSNAAYLDTNYFKNVPKEESKEFQKRRVETFKKNYNEKVREKRYRTNIEKYGVKTFAETEEFKSIMKEKASHRKNYEILWDKNKLLTYIKSFPSKPTIYELSKYLKYSYSVVGKHIKEYELQDYIDSKRSQPNIYWHDLILEKLGINLNYEGSIFGNAERCDLYFEDKKIGIDINPTASHNTQFNVYTRKPIGNVSTTYHRERAIKAEKNGWLLYQIFDWDDEYKVIFQLKNLFGLNERIYGRNCKVREISSEESKLFLDKYHLQGNIGATFRYGLFYGSELVSVMTFGKCRFRKDVEMELLRYCSKNTVVGGASKLFKYAIKNMNCKNIMTYSDMGKGNGKLYQTLNFKFCGYASLNGIYAPEKPTGEHLKTQEASREFKKNGDGFSTCKEYFNSKKWYRINDAGSKIWIWENHNYNSES